MSCKGLHCDGCGGNGGGALLAVLVVLGIVAAAVHAAWPTIVAVLVTVGHVLAWSFLALAVSLAFAGLGVLTTRIVRAVRPTRHTRSTLAPVTVLRTHRAVPTRPRPAITATTREHSTALPSWWHHPATQSRSAARVHDLISTRKARRHPRR